MISCVADQDQLAVTVLASPAFVEVERGAGAIHSVAFPQGTVRIDEIGGLDDNQAVAYPIATLGGTRSCFV